MKWKRKEINYFDMCLKSAEYSCIIAEKLCKIIRSPNLGGLYDNSLHDIEHAADMHMHKVLENLNREFITPIEREDIYEILKRIDDVTDSVETVANRLSMFHISRIRPAALPMFELIPTATQALYSLIREFKNYKRSQSLHSLLVEVNNIEEEGDRFFHSLMSELFEDTEDVIEIIKWKDLYQAIEDVFDNCEDIADIVGAVIIKNT